MTKIQILMTITRNDELCRYPAEVASYRWLIGYEGEFVPKVFCGLLNASVG